MENAPVSAFPPASARSTPPWSIYAFDQSGISYGNAIKLLRGGREAYPAMLSAIARSTRTVCLETYIFADDMVGHWFADALLEAAARGVECAVLVDAVGAGWLGRSFIERLRHGGVKFQYFRPLAALANVEFAVRRDHRKLLVVDGEVAFVGGLNIHAEAASLEQGGHGWLDYAVEVHGPAVGPLLEMFAETWHAVRPRKQAKLLAEIDGPLSEPAGAVALDVLGTDQVRGRWAIRRALLFAIRHAKSSVRIANAYFIPDAGVVRALRRAVKRGVLVEVMIPARSDIRIVDYAAGAALGPLLHAGVRAYHWTQTVLHAKVAVVDDVWSMVGSYNLDWFSLLRNREVVVTALDAGFGETLSGALQADFLQAEQVTVGSWDKRAAWRKYVAEPTAYAFRRWL